MQRNLIYCIPVILYILFFTGYLIKFKMGLFMRFFLVLSILQCVLYVIYFYIDWNLIINIISFTCWIPFCLGLCIYKNINKIIKCFSSVAIIFQITFAAFLFDKYKNTLVYMAAKCREYHEARGDVYGYN